MRNSFEGLMSALGEALKPVVAEEDKLAPPAVDLVQRYRKDPQSVESMFDNASELEALTPRALRKLGDILDLDTDIDNVNLLRVQMTAATAILNTQVKVDEGRLRRRKMDILPKLLERIAAEEGKGSQRALTAATVIDAELS